MNVNTKAVTVNVFEIGFTERNFPRAFLDACHTCKQGRVSYVNGTVEAVDSRHGRGAAAAVTIGRPFHVELRIGAKMKVDGQCHCGAIKYEAEVEPGNVVICNCADCQRQSGSVFRANIPAPAGSFRIVSGTPRKYLKISDSGAKRIHAFCANCGGPVYACAAENPQTYSLRIGALNQRYELGSPSRQIWMKRRFSWLTELDNVPGCEGQS
ncbi:GFA family protein [Caballeronia catudaia]